MLSALRRYKCPDGSRQASCDWEIRTAEGLSVTVSLTRSTRGAPGEWIRSVTMHTPAGAGLKRGCYLVLDTITRRQAQAELRRLGRMGLPSRQEGVQC